MGNYFYFNPKKIIVTTMLFSSIVGVVLSTQDPFSPVQTLANASFSISFNHELSPAQTPLTNAGFLTIVNNSSSLAGVPITDLAQSTSISATGITSSVISGTNRSIYFDGPNANVDMTISVLFSPSYRYSSSMTFSVKKGTGSGSLQLFINGSSSTAWTDSGSPSFTTHTYNHSSLINEFKFVSPGGNNVDWEIDYIDFGPLDLTKFIAELKTFTYDGPGCATTEVINGQTVTYKPLNNSDIEGLLAIYNSLTTEQQNTLKDDGVAWGRLKFLFSKANITNYS